MSAVSSARRLPRGLLKGSKICLHILHRKKKVAFLACLVWGRGEERRGSSKNFKGLFPKNTDKRLRLLLVSDSVAEP
jgi:hypothetical protein